MLAVAADMSVAIVAVAACVALPAPSPPRYMDKGRDCIEQGKLYARLLGALGKAGLRV